MATSVSYGWRSHQGKDNDFPQVKPQALQWGVSCLWWLVCWHRLENLCVGPNLFSAQRDDRIWWRRAPLVPTPPWLVPAHLAFPCSPLNPKCLPTLKGCSTPWHSYSTVGSHAMSSNQWHWPDTGTPYSKGAITVLYCMLTTPNSSAGAQCWC